MGFRTKKGLVSVASDTLHICRLRNLRKALSHGPLKRSATISHYQEERASDSGTLGVVAGFPLQGRSVRAALSGTQLGSKKVNHRTGGEFHEK